MPLAYTEDPALPESVKSSKEDYLIFYSSRVDGKMWCPDCRDVEDIVQNTFAAPDGPSGLVVWVGSRSEWKTPENPLTGGLWNVSSIPTIIRVKDGARLVESEIQNLASLVN